ncbi:hypothetical protein LbFV_ORF76 [Leptopilina boulardi filamentous virus]|uniref:Uncharacterized protein n=1 Tax=Leptopilina boulardi filamentous virus TaxID=552509 RepID=A0A1S5YDC0_9VIRU|nr:hypothetical protein LbFV_ORF76 [Leptopilina boulardi filamentous virus]AQQ79996.1 hypothetical protein LbFV_ORF76 [Leptopilina boulardi filamentous virus]
MLWIPPYLSAISRVESQNRLGKNIKVVGGYSRIYYRLLLIFHIRNIHFGLSPTIFRIYFPSRISEQTREIYTKKWWGY